MKRAIYAGSFDPPTLGHLWLMNEAAGLFDGLIVVVADNGDKKPFIPPQDRVQLIKQMTAGKTHNIIVDRLKSGLLVDYSIEKEFPYLVRGIRNINDFASENNMMQVNTELGNGYNTFVFLIPPPRYDHVSSSLVRNLFNIDVGLIRIQKYVPYIVYSYLHKMILEG